MGVIDRLPKITCRVKSWIRGSHFHMTGDEVREQSLSIGETGAEGNELGYETIAFAVTGI